MSYALSLRRFCVLACLIGAQAVPALADARSDLIDFFAGQGCAIGPSTREMAIAEGFAPAAIDALQAEEAARDGAVSGGGWLVMAPETCTMRPPAIAGELQITDPEVIAVTSAPDAYLDQDSPGCFLASDLLPQQLASSRGWDENRAVMEYIGLLGRSFISGDMTYYSTSNLLTPVGIQVLTGSCADHAPMAEMRQSHDFVIRNFDPIMRGFLAENICDDESSAWLMQDVNTLPGIASGTTTSNTWIPLEASMIAMAAGWQEGMTATEKGVSRPPLCHFAETDPADARMMKRKTRRE